MVSPNFDSLSSLSFDEYNSQIQGHALKSIRNALALPGDLTFHRSLDRDFGKEVDKCSAKTLSLTNRLLNLVVSGDDTQSTRSKGEKLRDQDDVVDNFHSLVVDAVDQLLERTDSCLDSFFGRTNAPAIAVNVAPQKKSIPRGRLDPSLQHASHLLKPQLQFNKMSNGLRHKYNAQVPMGYNLRDESDSSPDDKTTVVHPHPYRYEVKHITYTRRLFEDMPPAPLRSFEETPFTWIAERASFEVMLQKLRVVTELAIDLEHHDYRTFAGFLCLMQISTRDEDFIIDTLILRDELEALNEVLTDTKIVKVLHGAESDIVWLQQDFNLYIVNLFDTYHASKVLGLPKHGLAALLEMYCDFSADKRFQLADWRIRPLPQEMLMYARSDTHFLLHIYDNLRNALLDRSEGKPDLVREVLRRSEETSLRVYEAELYDTDGGAGPTGWDTLARKWNKSMSGLQQAIYRRVHAWRDQVARKEDESVRYVLPNQYLFKLAEHPPGDMIALLALFHSVPPLLRTHAKDLLDAIRSTVKDYSSNQQLVNNASMSSANPASSVSLIVEPATSMGNSVSSPLVESPQREIGPSSLARLWSNASGAVVSNSSSLLGPRRPPNPQYLAPQSSLFSTQSSSTVESQRARRARLGDAVARIHSTLSIAPTVPKTILTNHEDSGVISDRTMSIPDGSDMPGLGSGEQPEIVYIPAPQRLAASAGAGDSIVVVGQARKKRKRTRQGQVSEIDGTASGSLNQPPSTVDSRLKKSREDSSDSDHEQEPFDYSAEPNILDVSPRSSPQVLKQKPRKQKKSSGVFEYGNFPAPPKAHSELKSGNQSHTFR